jgi:teichuronic acid biosynthesis glycosyltransferase TuaC
MLRFLSYCLAPDADSVIRAMNVLAVLSNYPHAGHLYSGAFNESSVQALKSLGHDVTVLAPRPYAPRLLAAYNPRWRAYRNMGEYEVRLGVPVYRPVVLQVPRLGGAFWLDRGAELFCARTVQRLHRDRKFDAILSYNLIAAGGLAWRLAQRLGIPALGWATGNDVRMDGRTSYGRAVRRALERLDLVFYQSAELKRLAANLLGVSVERLSADRHMVLPRGIELPPAASAHARGALRAQLGLQASQRLVLYVGRMVRAKGVFDLADAAVRVLGEDPDLVFLWVGAKPGFDESFELETLIKKLPMRNRLRVLPECAHARVWDYLAAADIFAFPSYNEGMPNSLLEAMAAAVPALTYAIPAALEIDGGRKVLKMARPRDVVDLARVLAELASSAEQRALLAQRGKQRVREAFVARENLMQALGKIATLRGGVQSSAQSCVDPMARFQPSVVMSSRPPALSSDLELHSKAEN